jgi:hypothetical protein
MRPMLISLLLLGAMGRSYALDTAPARTKAVIPASASKPVFRLDPATGLFYRSKRQSGGFTLFDTSLQERLPSTHIVKDGVRRGVVLEEPAHGLGMGTREVITKNGSKLTRSGAHFFSPTITVKSKPLPLPQ